MSKKYEELAQQIIEGVGGKQMSAMYIIVRHVYVLN